MSRCRRKIVAGVTISRSPAKRPTGSVPASNASHARSGHVKPRMSPRPLAQGHRKLMAQDQDLGVLPPHLPPRRAQHRHGPGHDDEDQLQAHKPKIVARQPEPDLPPGTVRMTEPTASPKASAQVTQVFGTHSICP